MNWDAFENTIVSEVRKRYESLSNDLQKAEFLNGLHKAKDEMHELKTGGNINYCLPYIGEAYVIYYHMPRADNIFLALSEIGKSHQFPNNIKVLDIGSGTGSGATAICYWLSSNNKQPIHQTADLYAVERAKPMSRMAGSLIKPLQQQMSKNKVNLVHHHLSSTQTAIDRLGEGKFDLVLFSYTFDVYESDKQPEVMARILNLVKKLRQNGVAVFLTPKPNTASAKVEFTQALIEFLKANGMKSIPCSISRGKYSCKEKRSAILRVLCKFFNNECHRLGLPIIYSKQDDFPWYGFYGQCNALTWQIN